MPPYLPRLNLVSARECSLDIVDASRPASSSCLKMIVAQLMLVASVAKCSGLLGRSCRCGGNNFVPDREAGGYLGSPLGCTDQMAAGTKVLPDVAESKQEPLSLPR